MQGELFSIKTAGSIGDTSRLNSGPPNWLERFQFTLRLDHMAVAAISALVLYVLVFSFGVEKGKQIAVKEIRAGRIKQRQMAQELLKSQTPTKAVLPVAAAVSESQAAPIQTPPAPAEAPVTLDAKYTIQIITFTNRTRAEEEVKKLKEKGFQAFIIPGGKFFQVCVDGFEKMNDAKAKLIQLKQDGFAPQDAYIRPFSGRVSI